MKKISRWLIASLYALLLAGCSSVQFVPDYDAQVAKDLAEASALVFDFYDRLGEERIVKGKLAYASHSSDWGRIEVRLRVLLLRERSRPLNADSTEIVATTLKLWEKWRQSHRDTNDYTVEKMRIDRDHMSRNLEAAMDAEKAKQLGKRADTAPTAT